MAISPLNEHKNFMTLIPVSLLHYRSLEDCRFHSQLKFSNIIVELINEKMENRFTQNENFARNRRILAYI